MTVFSVVVRLPDGVAVRGVVCDIEDEWGHLDPPVSTEFDPGPVAARGWVELRVGGDLGAEGLGGIVVGRVAVLVA